MKEKVNRLAVLTKGIIKENPNLVLLLGTCPTLATTSSAFNGMGMGIAATAVLICSNIAISLLAKLIPDKVRIPCYIVLIAGFVTLVQFVEMVLKKFIPSLHKALGVYLPLITTNCAVLGVCINNIDAGYNYGLALINSLGAGIGFLLAMVIFSGMRSKLEGNTDIPAPFQGVPITMTAAALLSLAFMGFGGLV